MRILVTNDDGVYSPGLAALERELRTLGTVDVVAPQFEQSGVGHSITYLTPLLAHEVWDGPRRRGWAVEGSPADCVKLGITELLPARPDLVVSGINHGHNAGINVLYSGTVAAAIEGAFFGILSIAVSLDHEPHADVQAAARVARQVIEQILRQAGPGPGLFNVNIPLAALRGPVAVRVVPMGLDRHGDAYERRTDPRGRSYYWANGDPPPKDAGHETDLRALYEGFVTVTPLDYDLTDRRRLDAMGGWTWTDPVP